jgi:hypothetical protein
MGAHGRVAECPLSGVKRTWLPYRKMSAYDRSGHSGFSTRDYGLIASLLYRNTPPPIEKDTHISAVSRNEMSNDTL